MTRFSADWHARRELSVMEAERKLVDKTCGVSHPVWPLSKLVPHGPPQNFEFVHTGIGTARMDLGAKKSHAAGDAGSGNAPTRTSPRCDSSSAVVAPSERVVLAAVIRALALHPKVEWATRMNVGGMTLDGRHVRFGFKGCSDIIGQTTDGRFLAVEVKRPGAKATDDQIAFLCRVQRAGGVAFVAWSVDDVARGLA